VSWRKGTYRLLISYESQDGRRMVMFSRPLTGFGRAERANKRFDRRGRIVDERKFEDMMGRKPRSGWCVEEIDTTYTGEAL
jgi:hypothetical protein